MIKKISPRIEALEKIEQLQKSLNGESDKAIKKKKEEEKAVQSLNKSSIKGLEDEISKIQDRISRTTDESLIKQLTRESILLEEDLKRVNNLIAKTREEFQPTAGLGEAPDDQLADVKVDGTIVEISSLASVWDVLESSANKAGETMSRGLTNAIFQGENLLGVLGSVLTTFAQIAAQQALTAAIGSFTGGGLFGLIGGLFGSQNNSGNQTVGLSDLNGSLSNINSSINDLTLQNLSQGTRPIVANVIVDGKVIANSVKSADNTFDSDNADRSQI